MSNAAILIWEEIPEKVRVFLLPEEVLNEHTQLLKKCHGYYVNSVACEDDVTDDLLIINWAVSEYAEDALKQGDIPERELSLAGQWCQYECTNLPNLPADMVITKVYQMGFVF